MFFVIAKALCLLISSIQSTWPVNIVSNWEQLEYLNKQTNKDVGDVDMYTKTVYKRSWNLPTFYDLYIPSRSASIVVIFVTFYR